MPYHRSEEHTSELQSLRHLVCRLIRSEEHTSELQSLRHLVCRLLLEKKQYNLLSFIFVSSVNFPPSCLVFSLFSFVFFFFFLREGPPPKPPSLRHLVCRLI